MNERKPIVWVRYGRGWTQAQEVDRAGTLAVRILMHGRMKWYPTAHVMTTKPETSHQMNALNDAIEMRRRYEWLIEAWQKGYRSVGAILKMDNCQCASGWGIAQMLGAAKRRGWIKE